MICLFVYGYIQDQSLLLTIQYAQYAFWTNFINCT